MIAVGLSSRVMIPGNAKEFVPRVLASIPSLRWGSDTGIMRCSTWTTVKVRRNIQWCN